MRRINWKEQTEKRNSDKKEANRMKWKSAWRWGRDLNPWYGFDRIHAFQACSFNHSDTSPLKNMSIVSAGNFYARDFLLFGAFSACFRNGNVFLPRLFGICRKSGPGFSENSVMNITELACCSRFTGAVWGIGHIVNGAQSLFSNFIRTDTLWQQAIFQFRGILPGLMVRLKRSSDDF